MRVYISGKVTGNTGYWSDFERAESQLRDAGFDVMNPVKEVYDAGFAEYPYEQIMAYCLELLEECDAIYMMANYKDSNGAKMELNHAGEIGLKVLYEEK